MQTINTRADFDSATHEEQAAFKQILQGTIYRLEKDDTAQCWKAVEDNTTIERFGFTRADFPDATAPALPEYIAPLDPVQAQKNSEARGYLASTDWYAIRQQETGVAIPADVLAKRAEARLAVV